MHLTSLPGGGGLGAPARRFIDWLDRAGMTWWQTLPVGPPGDALSPYAARSLMAGGAHLIDPYDLARRGWLDDSQIALRDPTGGYRVADARRIEGLALRAAERFLSGARRRDRAQYEAFCDRESAWLDDWAIFDALAGAEGTADWTRWEKRLRRRHKPALARARRSLAEQIESRRIVQWFFDRQWRGFRQACASKGVRLMGDTPFYPSLFSADVWANQHLFDLDRAGRPRAVAGVPPDYFSRSGQVWDAPLYRWPAHERDGFAWWRDRTRRAAHLFDAVRLDHFIGFDRAWAVSARARSARRGVWRSAPGDEALRVVVRAAGATHLIAEDLGLITDQAARLRDRFGLPGMRVLQFGFADEPGNPHAPHAHVVNSVVYTGTHDNDTTRGWVASRARSAAGRAVLDRACDYLGARRRDLPDALVRAALASVANAAIIPVQDLLGLGSAARLNRPGSRRGVWRWRLDSMRSLERLAPALCERLALYERTPALRS